MFAALAENLCNNGKWNLTVLCKRETRNKIWVLLYKKVRKKAIFSGLVQIKDLLSYQI
jgi:hypothetical protein